MEKRILVLGAGGSAGINFIKSLRMATEKFYIVATDINKYHLELVDADKSYIIPKATDSRYLDVVNKLIHMEKIEFVHAQPDIEVFMISKNREKIDAKTFLPKHETIETTQNKIKTNQILKNKNVPAPISYKIEDVSSIKKYYNELKDEKGRVWVRALKGAGSRASLPAYSPEQIIEWINYWNKKEGLVYEDFMISEYLPGEEFAFQSIWKDGELIVSQARKRIEYLFGNITPSGQTSTPSVAVTVHNELVNKIGTEAIKAIDDKPNGVFGVDMKANKNGIPSVTEINAGRFYTTNNFYAHLGCNMPWIYIKLAFNEKIPLTKKYNAVEAGYYWIRLPDAGPILVKEGNFKSITLI
ncbi:MAG: ATP-grasp domain-containing protein [Thermoprotei archaeon]|jgi:carbamoyl-phosphate synthase large subunit